jgi:sarcosine oxidase subunit beta
MTSVVVIGGGIVGCSIAWALATDGLDVTIVERASGVGMGSTSASSAIVRMHYSTFEGVAVSWEAKQCWEDWAGHLGVVDESGMARYIQTGRRDPRPLPLPGAGSLLPAARDRRRALR